MEEVSATLNILVKRKCSFMETRSNCIFRVKVQRHVFLLSDAIYIYAYVYVGFCIYIYTVWPKKNVYSFLKCYNFSTN